MYSIGQRFEVCTGDNPARWRGNLEKALASHRNVHVEHRAALPYADMPRFMAELRQQEWTGARFIEFQILTAARPGEVKRATWSEISGDVWTIPPSHMKANKDTRFPSPPPR